MGITTITHLTGTSILVTNMNLRRHVLYDAIEKVKALVVIRLGGNELLKNSKQTRLQSMKVTDYKLNCRNETYIHS